MITVLAIVGAVALGLNAIGVLTIWAVKTIQKRKEL